MNAKVIKAYTDRLTGKVALVGDVVSLSSDRLDELVKGGFVVPEVDFDSMTVAGLREYIAGAGADVPDKAKKAELVEIAKGL